MWLFLVLRELGLANLLFWRKSLRCCDAFPSIEKVPRVKCPTLVIHGTDDEVFLVYILLRIAYLILIKSLGY